MRQPCLGGSRAARECALACAPPSRGGRASWRRAQRDGVAVLDNQRLDAVVDAHLDRGLRHVLDDVAAVAAEVSLPAALGRHRGQALRAARRGRLGRAPAGRWGAGTGATPRALRAAWRCRAGCGGGRSGAAPGPVVKLAAPGRAGPGGGARLAHGQAGLAVRVRHDHQELEPVDGRGARAAHWAPRQRGPSQRSASRGRQATQQRAGPGPARPAASPGRRGPAGTAGRTGAGEPAGGHELEHAALAGVTCARRRVSARRAGGRGRGRGHAPAGAPGPVRSASCTCQGSGPMSGCPNGDVWKGEPGLCWARRLGAGVGVAAGMPGAHAMAPAELAPAAGAAERVDETWRAACAPQRRLNFKMARREPRPALLRRRCTRG